MKWFLGLCLLVTLASCSDAGASSEPVTTPSQPEMKCALQMSAPSYFVGESCPKGDWLLQGIQSVTQNGQLVRGVRCVTQKISCQP